MKLSLVHYLSSEEVHRLFGSSAGLPKKLSSVKLPLLEECSAILAQIEEKYSVLGLDVDFIKKEIGSTSERSARKRRTTRVDEKN